MAFRLSDLNAVTASIGTDLLHLRTVAGLDKKITNTNFFNTIPTITVLGAATLNTTLTVLGQVILARDGGTVDIHNDINLTASKGINLGSSDFRIDSGGVGNRAIVIENTNAAVDAHVYIRAGVSGGVLMNDSNDSSLFLGRGAFTSAPRLVVATSVGDLPTFSANTVALFQNNDSPTLSSIVTIIGGETGASYLYFGDKDLQNPGSVFYSHDTDSLNWSTDGAFAMRLTADNELLVNTTSALANLTVNGDMRIIGSLGDLYTDSFGNSLNFTRDNVTFLWNRSANGFFAIGTANRSATEADANLVCNLDKSVTVNTTLHTDTIAEKTAAGVTVDGLIIKDQGFANKVTWEKYFYSATSITEAAIFTAIQLWIPNNGNILPCHGSLGTGYITGIRRLSATLIRIAFNDTGNGTGGVRDIDSTDGVTTISSIEIMSTYETI